jgi:hypothetical protein
MRWINIEARKAIWGFLNLSYSSSNTKVCDATNLKREGKKVYGAKLIKNYVVGCYELLQDVLFTVERYKGLNFISDLQDCQSQQTTSYQAARDCKSDKNG